MNRNHRDRRVAAHAIKLPIVPASSFSLMNSNSGENKPARYSSPLIREMRNPLCSINLACDVLKSADLDEEQRTCLAIIMRGSARINGLVNTLLKSEM